MTDKELKKLSRNDLLRLLLEQSKKLQTLEEDYNAAISELENRKIVLENAGSIAEAALKLNGVFEAAQAACEQYTENIAVFDERQREIEKAGLEKARLTVEVAKRKAAEIENEARINADNMLKKAERESREYWDDVYKRLNAFLTEHDELKQYLSVFQRKRDNGS